MGSALAAGALVVSAAWELMSEAAKASNAPGPSRRRSTLGISQLVRRREFIEVVGVRSATRG